MLFSKVEPVLNLISKKLIPTIENFVLESQLKQKLKSRCLIINKLCERLMTIGEENGFQEVMIALIRHLDALGSQLKESQLNSVDKNSITKDISLIAEAANKLLSKKSFVMEQNEFSANNLARLYQNQQSYVKSIPFNKGLKKAYNYLLNGDNFFVPPSVYMVYANPSNGSDESEKHIQPFLKSLRKDLKSVGVYAKLDIEDNQHGSSVYQYIKQVEDSDYVLVFGTSSLLIQHNNATSLLTEELNTIIRKRKATLNTEDYRIIPILLNGDLNNSFPLYYLYNRVLSWMEGNYVEHFISLIKILYQIPENDKKFKEIEKIFFSVVREEDKVPINKSKQATLNNTSINLSNQITDKNSNDYREFNMQETTASFSYEDLTYLPDSYIKFIGRDFYIGKDQEPGIIHEKLFLEKNYNHRLVLKGYRGIGKSQIAKTYARKYEKQYKFVFWIKAGTIEDFYQSYLSLAERINYSIKDPQNRCDLQKEKQELINDVNIWLAKNANSNWLLIYDNGQDEPWLNQSFPKRGGHILITAYKGEWENMLVEEIKCFDREESINLLVSLSKDKNLDQADKLADCLKDFPLAISQVGYSIKNAYDTIEKYYSYFLDTKKRQELLSKKPSNSEYNETMITVWTITKELIQIEAEKKQLLKALDLLNLCSCLNSTNIPLSLFKQWYAEYEDLSKSDLESNISTERNKNFNNNNVVRKENHENDSDNNSKQLSNTLLRSADLELEDYLNEIFHLFETYCLITVDKMTQTISFHELIHLIIFDTIEHKDKVNSINILLPLLKNYLQAGSMQVIYKEKYQWVPHVLSVGRKAFDLELRSELLAEILLAAADILLKASRDKDSIDYYEMARKIYLEINNQVGVLNALKGLSSASEIISPDEAEKFYSEAIQKFDSNTDPKIKAKIYNNYGIFHARHRRYPKAKEEFERASEIYQQFPDLDPLQQINLLSNLASVQYYIGDNIELSNNYLKKAQEKLKSFYRVEDFRKLENIPEAAPWLYMIYNNLARNYRVITGNYPELLNYTIKAYEIMQKQFLTHTIESANVILNLSNILLSLDKIHLAKLLLSHVFDIIKNIHADKDPLLILYAKLGISMCLSYFSERQKDAKLHFSSILEDINLDKELPTVKLHVLDYQAAYFINQSCYKEAESIIAQLKEEARIHKDKIFYLKSFYYQLKKDLKKYIAFKNFSPDITIPSEIFEIYQTNYYELAKLYELQGDIKAIVKDFEKAGDLYNKALKYYIESMEKENHSIFKLRKKLEILDQRNLDARNEIKFLITRPSTECDFFLNEDYPYEFKLSNNKLTVNFMQEHYYIKLSKEVISLLLVDLYILFLKELDITNVCRINIEDNILIITGKSKILENMFSKLKSIKNKSYTNEEVFPEIKSNLENVAAEEKKVCDDRLPVTTRGIMQMKRRSIINEVNLSDTTYTVAIMRLIGSRNEEHAFLLIEGLKSIKRIDLFIDTAKPDYSTIEIKEETIEGKERKEVKNTLAKMLKNIKSNWRFLAWDITQEQHDQLIKDIMNDKANPPKYAVLGDRSTGYKSKDSTSETRHSCFTWARQKLLNLNEDAINKELAPMVTDLIGGKTSLYLDTTPFWQKPEVIVSVAGAVTVAAAVTYQNSCTIV